MTNNVNHPAHYDAGDPYECILLAEQYSFNVGNMIKYVWRHNRKGHPKEDLEKALWYARRAKANGEGFAGHACTDSLYSEYDYATLCRLKRDRASGAEHDFWDCMAEANDEPAIDALAQMLKEAQ